MMEQEGRLAPKEMLLSDRHVAILRLIGQGRSREEVVGELSLDNNDEFKKELKNASDILGVSGQTAAVNRAITLGILNLEELVEPDFDWQVFDDLNDKEKSILNAFIRAKEASLTEEEVAGLKIQTLQNPKTYVRNAVERIYSNKLGLNGKTQAVVYYRAFLEKEEKTDGKKDRAELSFTEKEVRFLELTRQGLQLSVIGQRLFGNRSTADNYKSNILHELGVSSLEKAIAKAEEMGILSKKAP